MAEFLRGFLIGCAVIGGCAAVPFLIECCRYDRETWLRDLQKSRCSW